MKNHALFTGFLDFTPCGKPVKKLTNKKPFSQIRIHRFFHVLTLCEKCPVHRFYDFRPCEKPLKKPVKLPRKIRLNDGVFACLTH